MLLAWARRWAECLSSAIGRRRRCRDVRLAKQRTGGDVTALLQQRQSRIPLPFMGDGRDTANAALFLAYDEARFVTGTEIVVDGGMSVRCD